MSGRIPTALGAAAETAPGWPRRRRRLTGRRLAGDSIPYLLVLPVIAVMGAILGYPIYRLFRLSLERYGLFELIRHKGVYIGLHNFGEGLAIGASAAAGAIGLATVLVIGFALHNATEGFGIVAPLAADGDRPSWGFLLLMGLIGGGPTFLGTAVGRQFTSAAVSVIFLTLAAGSILYVVIQLLGVAHKNGRKDLLYWGVLLGLAAGFLPDMVATAGGA